MGKMVPLTVPSTRRSLDGDLRLGLAESTRPGIWKMIFEPMDDAGIAAYAITDNIYRELRGIVGVQTRQFTTSGLRKTWPRQSPLGR